MDKVIAFLYASKKHHFWVLCGTIAVLSLVTWYLSTDGLARAYATEYGKIKQQREQLKLIASEPKHPNSDVFKEMEIVIQKRRDDVKLAWETKWKQYKDVLVWPGNLTNEFIEAAKPLRPIEKLSPSDEPALIPKYLEEYRGYIRRELPLLADIVGSRWDPGRDETERIPGLADETQIVHWNDQDQSRIQHTNFDWDERPTTLQVLYAQEDLWVLRALLEIIHETNAGAKTNSSAAVKKIIYVHWGRDAKDQVGQITLVTGDKQRGRGAPSSGRQGAGRPGREKRKFGADGQDVDPADERYVDEKYEPLPGNDLRAAVTGKNASSLVLAVAKRMPIRMRLVVDQRRIDDLLIACANSPLTVEVRQVRFNPDSKQMGATSSATSRPTTSSRHGQTEQDQERESYDATIELYGIIYIYNPVDEKLLGYE